MSVLLEMFWSLVQHTCPSTYDEAEHLAPRAESWRLHNCFNIVDQEYKQNER